MFVRAYLDAAEAILSQYAGSEPLPAFLKKFFAQNKKYGSRDRKQISHLCFCYYRLGHALNELPVADKLLAGLFLCSAAPQPVLAQLRPEWNEQVTKPLAEKVARLGAAFDLRARFPFAADLSPEINAPAFMDALLEQPDTFLRVRPGKLSKVIAQLEDAGLAYRQESGNCIALAPGAKLDELLMLNRDAVVQDRSSQMVLSLLDPVLPDKKSSFSSWDCCAASGGKSILLHDAYPNAQLTVSDIRESIVVNLKKRFAEAGITRYDAFVADITAPGFTLRRQFDLVLCDAPCSGSGTWGRAPEQLYFFNAEKIAHYAALQAKIAARALEQVRSGGLFLYITCSVFAAENEAVVQQLTANQGVSLLAQEYFTGYGKKADTLFAALLRRS